MKRVLVLLCFVPIGCARPEPGSIEVQSNLMIEVPAQTERKVRMVMSAVECCECHQVLPLREFRRTDQGYVVPNCIECEQAAKKDRI